MNFSQAWRAWPSAMLRLSSSAPSSERGTLLPLAQFGVDLGTNYSRGALGKPLPHPPPPQARPSYLGCLMGTSSTNSGGIWKSSGSLPFAWSRSGRTSKRLRGGFQPCCMQICKQSHQVRPLSPRPSRRNRGKGRGKGPRACPQRPLPSEALGQATSYMKFSLISSRN